MSILEHRPETILNPHDLTRDLEERELHIPPKCLSCPGILSCVTKALGVLDLPGENTPMKNQVFDAILDHADTLIGKCSTGIRDTGCGSSVIVDRLETSPFPVS